MHCVMLNYGRSRAYGRPFALCEFRLKYLACLQSCACAWCHSTKTSASPVLLTASFCLVSSLLVLSQLYIHLFMLSLHLDMCALHWLKIAQKRFAHFHGSGASASTHKILAMPCLLNKPSHALHEQLKRVSAGHQAMHQELTTLRSMPGTRSRVRLVEPQTLMPDWIRKKNGPSWQETSSAWCT